MMHKFFILSAMGVSALLAGCGFTPMHAPTASGAQLQDVAIQLQKGKDVADNQAGFLITQRLRDRLGKASDAAPYTVTITPGYRRARLGLTDGDVASRYDVTVTAGWVLTDTKTGGVVDRGTASSISTFGAPSGPFGVITADDVGVEQASKDTADDLIIALAKAFATVEK